MNENDIYKIFDLTAQVYVSDTNDNELISERLINYLNDIASGNIIDITLVNDAYAFDQEKNVYANTLEFKCIYGN